MMKKYLSFLNRCLVYACALASSTLVPLSEAQAQVAPVLGTAKSFAVLGGSTTTNTGPTIVTGDLGVSPGSAVTGFPPGTVVGGTIHPSDAVAAQAQNDTTVAYNMLAGQACNTTFGVPTDVGGQTLVPGVYCFASTAQLTGVLTLNAGGNPDAVWVFKVASALTTASNSSVQVINGAQQCNVFWQVGSSAIVGTGTNFVGNVLALQSITLATNAKLAGRALARNGAVTMDSNQIASPACAVPPGTTLPPSIGKAFSPATVSPGAASTLTLTLTNPDASVANLTAPLVDTMPVGLTVSPGASTNCGGSLSTTSSSVTLTGGSIPAKGSCTISANVSAVAGGNLLNSLAAGALQTQNGSNTSPAAATLTVLQPASAPTLGKSFSPPTISAGGISTLTITLSNTDATAAFLTAAAPLTDTLPAGLVIAGVPSNTCGGAVTSGASTVTLTAGSIPAKGSCTVSVPVTATSGGNYLNTLTAGALQTSNGSNAAPAIATLTVNAPVGGAPTLGKTFVPATIPAGGVSLLTITLSNSNGSPLGLTKPLTDTFPNGVTVSGIANTTCGGSVVAGSSSVTLASGTIPAMGSCTVTVPVAAGSGGSFINSLAAGALQTQLGGNVGPAIATLTVSSPSPVALAKTFSPTTIEASKNSVVTITLSNTGSKAAKLTAPLTDLLPSGVVIAGKASTTCACESVSATTGGSKLVVTGGTIPPKGFCTVSVPVTATTAGSYINLLAAGALQTNQGISPAPAAATLIVTKPVVSSPPVLSKSFSPSTIKAGGIATLTITLRNPNSTAIQLTKALTDNLPSGMLVSGNTTTTCTGGTLPATTSSTMGGKNPTYIGNATVVLERGSIPALGACTVTVKVTAKSQGSYCNTMSAGALQTDKGKNIAAAVATLMVNR